MAWLNCIYDDPLLTNHVFSIFKNKIRKHCKQPVDNFNITIRQSYRDRADVTSFRVFIIMGTTYS